MEDSLNEISNKKCSSGRAAYRRHVNRLIVSISCAGCFRCIAGTRCIACTRTRCIARTSCITRTHCIACTRCVARTGQCGYGFSGSVSTSGNSYC